MQDRKMLLAGIVALSFVVAACAKSASDAPADSTAASAPAAAAADHSADIRAIIAADSGWMRNVMAKNVDSLMTYYTPDAVSYGFAGPAGSAKGSEQIRAVYAEMVKANVTNPKMSPNTISFSDDGSMAMDHGTYSMTVTPPGGKASTDNGAFLNVWKRVDGQWKLVAEMSTPIAPPKT